MEELRKVPHRDEVSPGQQDSYDMLKKVVGFMPNLYAALAFSPTALKTFLIAQGATSSLSNKEKEAISLIVSQVNECDYCISAHTELARKSGFNDTQLIEIRNATVNFDPKLNALIKLTKVLVITKGNVHDEHLKSFFDSGYTKANLMDLIVLVGLRIITNYVYAVTKVQIDWPMAPQLHGF